METKGCSDINMHVIIQVIYTMCNKTLSVKICFSEIEKKKTSNLKHIF